MKKIFAAILVIALLSSAMAPACFAAENDVVWTIIAEEKATTINATNTMIIIDGIAHITLYCKPSGATATYIQATSYIEKQVGSQWVVMPLENGDTQWSNITSSTTMNTLVTQKLTTGTGTYRVTTNYVVYLAGIGNRPATATYTAIYN